MLRLVFGGEVLLLKRHIYSLDEAHVYAKLRIKAASSMIPLGLSNIKR